MRRSLRNILILCILVLPIALVSLSYLEDIVETGGEGTAGIVSFFTDLPRRAMDLASGTGYVGIFVLMLLEAAAFPIPSEIILPFAGYLVFRGSLDFWSVVLVSTVAALVGSFIDYYLGWKLGESLLIDSSTLRFIDANHLRRAQMWFARYGTAAVALFRLLPAARVLISFPAGVCRMSRSKFALYTMMGCLPWNITLIYLGLWLGSSWEKVVVAFRYFNLVVYALLIFLVVWIVRRFALRKSLLGV